MSAFNDEQLAEVKQLIAAAVKVATDGLKAAHSQLRTDLGSDHSQLRADFEATQNPGGVTADDTDSRIPRDNQEHHRKDIPQRGVRA